MGAISLTGGCQCGAVRYRLDAEPNGANICHCRMCQKASGGPFMTFAGVPIGRLFWTRGLPKFFQSSAIAERGFCAECGTPLTYRLIERDRISVTIGSLDEPAAVAPEIQYGVESSLPWLDGALALPAQKTSDWLKLDAAAVGSRQHPDRENLNANGGSTPQEIKDGRRFHL
jgi:hypothetical protein